MSRFRRSHDDDNGAVAVIVALCTVVLFGMSALAVDIGRMYEVRRNMQSAADLAALAGAQDLRGGKTTDAMAVEACRDAVQYLIDNTPSGQAPYTNHVPNDCTSPSGTADGAISINGDRTQITVTTISKQVDFSLAPAIGINNGRTGATATAGIASPSVGIEPFFLTTSDVPGVTCLKDSNPASATAMRTSFLPVAGTITLDKGVGSTAGGYVVTITGSGFSNGSKVFLDTTQVTTQNVNTVDSTTIKVTMPAHAAGDVNLTVTTGNTTTDPVKFTYMDPALSIAPGTGSTTIATPVVLSGNGFDVGQTKVVFDGQDITGDATITTTSISFPTPVPHNAGQVVVSVWNPSTGFHWNNVIFTYAAAASVVTLTPSLGSTAGGDSVTISQLGGTTFTSSSQVTWAGTVLPSSFNSGSKTLVITTPAHAAGSVDVFVTTGGDQSQTVQFSYVAQALTLSPNVGTTAGGEQIVISQAGGPAFTNGSTVDWGGTKLSGSAVKYSNVDGTLTITAPAHSAGAIAVTVTTGSTTSSPATYTYVEATPDPCVETTGDFGYLDMPRVDSLTPELTYNSMLGMQNSGRIIHQLPSDGICPADDATLDMYLDTVDNTQGTKTLKPVVTCLNILNGGKLSQVTDGLVTGAGGQPGKLEVPPHTHSGQQTTTVLGHTIDGDNIADYVTNGMDESAFLTALKLKSLPDGVLDASIVDCPRFFFVPVLDTPVNPQNANNYWAIKDFMGVFIKDFVVTNSQVTAITAYALPMNLLPAVVAKPDGTIPYIGTGPVTPVLIK